MSRLQASIRGCLAGLLVSCALGCGFGPPAGGGEVMDSGPHIDAPPDTPPDEPPPVRATAGLVALWRFDEVSGAVANDTRSAVVPSPVLPPIPLPISDPASVTWDGGGLRLDAPVRAGTAAAAHVCRDVLRTGEVTMEVWASPAVLSQGDGVIVPGNLPNYALVLSISPRYSYHNAMIAQVGDRWQGRVLTAATDANALPVIETPPGTITGVEPVHLVLVASATERVLYVNGTPHRAAPAAGIGPLNAPAPAVRWFDYFPVSIGQERDTDQKRSWLGTIWFAAIYDRALTLAEIQQNRAAGHACAGC